MRIRATLAIFFLLPEIRTSSRLARPDVLEGERRCGTWVTSKESRMTASSVIQLDDSSECKSELTREGLQRKKDEQH